MKVRIIALADVMVFIGWVIISLGVIWGVAGVIALFDNNKLDAPAILQPIYIFVSFLVLGLIVIWAGDVRKELKRIREAIESDRGETQSMKNTAIAESGKSPE